jgi:hypothetical protein
MGFFSWKCSECSSPIISEYAIEGVDRLSPLTKASLLLKDGKIVEGTYDGYGRIGDVDLVVASSIVCGFSEDRDTAIHSYFENQFPVRVVHSQCLKDKKYDDVNDSENDPGQGYFYGDEDLDEFLTLMK